MSAIATGYLKVETFAGNQGEILTNVMIRIYKLDAQELVFEDFFMTKKDGSTQLIPLYTPTKEMTMMLNQVEPPYEQYHIEANCKGFQTYKIKGIQIFADETSIIQIRMESITHKENKVEYELEHHQRFINPLPNIQLMVWNSKKKVNIPEQIKVTIDKQDNEYDKSITISFLEYLENCACSELYPTWPKKVLQWNVILLMTMIMEHFIEDEQSLVLKEISSTKFGIHYIPNQVLFQSVLDVVHEVYGYVLCTSESKQKMFVKLKQNWNPWILLNTCFEDLQEQLDISINIKKLYVIKPLVLTSKKKNLKKYRTKKEMGVLQKQLRTVASYYKEVPFCNITSQYDDETINSILAFQRMLGIQMNMNLQDKTEYLIQKIYEELKEEHR